MKEFTQTQDTGGDWIVTAEKLPGFIAKGKTKEEAIEKMKAAFKMYYPCGECKDK